MSPREASSPGAGSNAADGNERDANNDQSSIIETHGDGRPSKGNGSFVSQSSYYAQRQLHPRVVHAEEEDSSSVAHVTVSDPIQCTEGIKGKYTAYRVAYDPPLLPPDSSSPSSPSSTSSSSSSSSSPLFPHPTSANRRYSDFTWLFERLHKERPGAIVPPLPDKQRGASLFDGAFIEERRFHLEVFLRRAVLNPELSDAECLLVFLGGSDAEFRRALRDGGSFGGSSRGGGSSNSNVDADDCNGHASDGAEAYCHDPQDHHPPLPAAALAAVGGGVEKLTTKKAAGIKKWIKEKKTIMQCAMVRSPDDVVFERANHYVAALEAGLVRIEAQASRMVKGERELSSCMLEFGLGCDALAHVDDEICGMSGTTGSGTGDDGPSRSSGIGRTFRLIGRSADGASAAASAHHERGSGRFHEPLRDHLRVVQAVKVALSKPNNRLVTYSTCLNAVDSKRASLHKYRITLDHQKAMGAEASLGRAEAAAVSARANYEEVSARVLREVDRFRREYAVAMHATMAEFARAQREHYEGMNEVWASLLPQVESLDAPACNGSSFAREAAALREGKSGGGGGLGWGGGDVAHLDGMPMPMYPPPPEPTSNGTHNRNAMESSMLSGAIRYRDASPEE